jgi:hypothetical protein
MMEVRFTRNAAKRLKYLAPLQHHYAPASLPFATRHNSTKAERQAIPIGGFYDSILSSPLPTIKKALETPSLAHTQREEIAAKAKIVFGSRLAGPAERRETKAREASMIAGVMVPPKPEEPDNCCMSGCVNCVWDVYRDDLEEYVAASKKADAASRRQRAKGMDISMEGDGGGSELTSPIATPVNEFSDELFKGVPVGIREFMKTEKRLKEKHLQQDTRPG